MIVFYKCRLKNINVNIPITKLWLSDQGYVSNYGFVPYTSVTVDLCWYQLLQTTTQPYQHKNIKYGAILKRNTIIILTGGCWYYSRQSYGTEWATSHCLPGDNVHKHIHACAHGKQIRKSPDHVYRMIIANIRYRTTSAWKGQATISRHPLPIN